VPLARGELDLAVVVADRGGTPGEFLARDPKVWATSCSHLAHEADPLPVALFEPGCWWRNRMLAALDARGRRWRVACTSASVAGVAAAVAAGIAFGVLARSTIPLGARALVAAEGFAPLPGSDVVLRRGPCAASPAVAAMRAAIRDAFGAAPGR
jgi:DNA-binding transcriptional LysR family regulator